MRRAFLEPAGFLLAGLIAICPVLAAEPAGSNGKSSAGEQHPWRPPFGLDRVGVAVPKGESAPEFEAAAVASTANPLHPVDLGLIFVPEGWLVLSDRQTAFVEVAAVSHARPLPSAQLRVWFESQPGDVVERSLSLPEDRVVRTQLDIDPPERASKSDSLHVTIRTPQGRELWHTTITTMFVASPIDLPSFGATALKLRYDMPIVLNHSDDRVVDMSKISFMDYETGWDETLNDVVVSLPNGSRFVFWRGSCYIPFWAGEHNTGLCYEWAETRPPPGAFVDSIEPLMDKELRHSHVEIVEATAARVHVRWTYQSVSFKYETFGDQAVEDYYFYPDGYGTRALHLSKRPDAPYELTEFIALSAAGKYPLDFLPRNAVRMLYLDNGESHTFQFPPPNYSRDQGGAIMFDKRRDAPVLYRIRTHRQDKAEAIYFYPSEDHFPQFQFAPFFDGDILVTPGYWGSHWPLARGKMTGGSIDPLIAKTPGHTSLLTWAMNNEPTPLSAGRLQTVDALGRSVEMESQRYAWLIGMTEEADEQVLQRARSFARPPSVTVQGAMLDAPAYIPERREIRLRDVAGPLTIRLTPQPVTVNPVFELLDAPPQLTSVTLNNEPLPPDRYAWDGKTLWIDATINQPQTLTVHFHES